jgi:4-hydroxy-3-polyprenylbenzoate decarboxylase
MTSNKRVVIGMTGATGAIYGLRLLEVLHDLGGWETHLIVSSAGALNIQHELHLKRSDVYAKAAVVHDVNDVGASIASGAFRTEGMIIAPCSMKTLASVAHGLSDNLMSRAADVTLKERRRLIMVPRETPLHLVHLRNMAIVTEMGGIIFPPLPAFYGQAKTLAQLIDETVGRILGLFGIEVEGLFEPWLGIKDR